MESNLVCNHMSDNKWDDCVKNLNFQEKKNIQVMKERKICINPLTTSGGYHVTSPNSIHILYSKQVMRTLKLIRYNLLP